MDEQPEACGNCRYALGAWCGAPEQDQANINREGACVCWEAEVAYAGETNCLNCRHDRPGSCAAPKLQEMPPDERRAFWYAEGVCALWEAKESKGD